MKLANRYSTRRNPSPSQLLRLSYGERSPRHCSLSRRVLREHRNLANVILVATEIFVPRTESLYLILHPLFRIAQVEKVVCNDESSRRILALFEPRLHAGWEGARRASSTRRRRGRRRRRD